MTATCLESFREIGRTPVAVFTDAIDGPRGDLARPRAPRRFALEHSLPVVTTSKASVVPRAALTHGILLVCGDPSIAV